MTTEAEKDLQDLQKRAQALSEYRDKLSALFLTLQAGLAEVKNNAMPDIKRIARQVAKAHKDLVDGILAHPELFEKPRSYVVDGVKFGMQKQVGSLAWDDDRKLCDRIARLVDAGELTGEEADLLVATTEKPVAAALAKLDPKLLKKLGVTIEGAGDQPLVKSVDNSIEKAVNGVINAAIKEASAEEDA